MAQQWFKFYGADFLIDPKIKSLTATERSCLITLFCYASTAEIPGEIKYLKEYQLMVDSGLDPMQEERDNTKGVLDKFSSLGIIKIDSNEMITLLNYRKRQDVALTNYERVKKFREKKRDDNTNETQDNANDNTRREEKRRDKKRKEDATVSDLKLSFFKNPIINQIIKQFPDRNYEFEFNLMADWWIKSKKKLPQNISAFSNWLKNTKPDEVLQKERLRALDREEQHRKQKELEATPRASQETLNKFQEAKKQIGKL